MSESKTNKPYLITRFLFAFLPRRLTKPKLEAPVGRPITSKALRLLDFVLYSGSFRLTLASALGHSFEASDFPDLTHKRHVAERLKSFDQAFSKYRGTNKSDGGNDTYHASRYPLIRALILVFRRQIIEGLICNALWVSISLSGKLLYKLLLQYLLRFYHVEAVNLDQRFGEGVLYILALTGLIVVEAILSIRGFYVLSIVGAEARSLCAILLTRKSLNISPIAQRDTSSKDRYQAEKENIEAELSGCAQNGPPNVVWSPGMVLNLVNTDTERIGIAMREFNKAWSFLVAYPLAIGLSYWVVGWPGIAGFSIAPIFIVIVIFLIRSLIRLRLRLNATSDSRVNTVDDLMLGIRILKALSWEDIYAEKIWKIRARESKLNQGRVKRNGTVAFIAECTGRASPILGVALYSKVYGVDVLASPNLIVFVILFYKVGTFAAAVPEAIIYLVDAWLSIRRIQEYMLAEDFEVRSCDSVSTEVTTFRVQTLAPQVAVEATTAEFSWTKRSQDENNNPKQGSIDYDEEFVLRPISMSIGTGELLAITGATSSGKTTLAAGLAGWLPLLQGQINRQAVPLYAPALPWIRSATVRDNIVWGSLFDNDLYAKVVRSCHLSQDFEQFEFGDMTTLGERGITLSGGQRARVGLARALYMARMRHLEVDPRERNRIPIVIMDDPLSALDVKVSESIFHEVILNEMANMTRILVTHQTRVLSQCDRVIWMEAGRVCAIGTFADLMKYQPFRQHIGNSSQLSANTSTEVTQCEEKGTSAEHQCASALMSVEDEEKHSVPWRLYATYTYLPASLCYFVTFFIMYLISQVANVLWGVLFAWWTGQQFDLHNEQWIGMVTAVFVFQLMLIAACFTLVQISLIHCAKNAGNRALKGVLKAPLLFLDTTPLGRIINRFTQVTNSPQPPHAIISPHSGHQHDRHDLSSHGSLFRERSFQCCLDPWLHHLLCSYSCNNCCSMDHYSDTACAIL